MAYLIGQVKIFEYLRAFKLAYIFPSFGLHLRKVTQGI